MCLAIPGELLSVEPRDGLQLAGTLSSGFAAYGFSWRSKDFPAEARAGSGQGGARGASTRRAKGRQQARSRR